MAKTTSKKMVMEKVEINGVIRTEALRLADIAAILNGEERDEAIIEDLKNYVAHKTAQVANRKATSAKDDPEKQKTNEEIKAEILAFLGKTPDKWYRVGDIMKGCPVLLNTYSPSKITNVITDMVKIDKTVIRDQQPKMTTYTLAPETAE